MLKNADAVATIAVKNLDAAAKFYEGTLGLSRAGGEDGEVIVFESGDTSINVYKSNFAGTNKATALTWTVDDVEDIVRSLKEKGVKFEHYDLPEDSVVVGLDDPWASTFVDELDESLATDRNHQSGIHVVRLCP